MDVAEVERYLARKLGAKRVKVAWFKQSFPGMSRETFLCRAAIADAAGEAERGFVFRRDPPGGGVVPIPLRREWEIYARLAGSQVPVGEPLWWEDEPDWTIEGRPFFVRALVEGSTEVPHIGDPDPKHDALREACAKEHAEKLALLHTLDWERLRFGDIIPAPSSPEEAALHDLQTWGGIWEDVRLEPHPIMTEALSWFRERLPRAAPRLSLLKGNNGFGEEIWHDARIVAMSDWELASIGDPSQDWAWASGEGALQVWDEEKTLRHYESAAGFEIPRENLTYYRMWKIFKIVTCVVAGLRGFVAGKDARPALATMGLGAAALMEQALAELVLGSTETAEALAEEAKLTSAWNPVEHGVHS